MCTPISQPSVPPYPVVINRHQHPEGWNKLPIHFPLCSTMFSFSYLPKQQLDYSAVQSETLKSFLYPFPLPFLSPMHPVIPNSVFVSTYSRNWQKCLRNKFQDFLSVKYPWPLAEITADFFISSASTLSLYLSVKLTLVKAHQILSLPCSEPSVLSKVWARNI